MNLEPLGRRAGADRIDAAQEMYRGMAQCGQNLGGTPLANPTLVLVERHVTHVMQFVLDPPVRPDPFEKVECRRFGPTETRSGVVDRPRFLPLESADTFHTNDLLGLGEAPGLQPPAQQVAALSRPDFDPPMAFVDCLRRRYVRIRRLYRGEKTP